STGCRITTGSSRACSTPWPRAGCWRCRCRATSGPAPTPPSARRPWPAPGARRSSRCCARPRWPTPTSTTACWRRGRPPRTSGRPSTSRCSRAPTRSRSGPRAPGSSRCWTRCRSPSGAASRRPTRRWWPGPIRGGPTGAPCSRSGGSSSWRGPASERAMRIDAIDVYWVKIPLAFVWRTSYADQHVTDTILVRMEGGGHHAWGESCPPYIPGYSADHTLAVYHTLREHMVPRIIGQDVETPQDILDRLAFIKGNQFARAALDITWWVLDARRRGLPLHRALGGTADRVKVGADFGIQDSLDALMEKIQGAVDAGFPRVKLKYRPGWDLFMVEAVRKTFPHLTIHIDCNAAYSPADTAMFRALDRFELAMIEQPLADDGLSLVNHAALQRQIATPICLDESIQSLAHTEAAIALGACRVVNIKMARVGGLTESRLIQARCAEHG